VLASSARTSERAVAEAAEEGALARGSGGDRVHRHGLHAASLNSRSAVHRIRARLRTGVRALVRLSADDGQFDGLA